MKMPIKGKSRRPTRSAKSNVLVPRAKLSAARLPANQEFLLRYSDLVSLNPGALGVGALYQFRANDLYDPDFSGTGHQPIGFDQVMPFYNHFTVTKSRCRISVAQPTLTSTGYQWCALYLTGASGDTSSSTLLSELHEVIEPTVLDWGPVGSANNGVMAMFRSRWIKFDGKMFFGKAIDVNYANFQGTASSSPTELAFFNILAGSWDESTDTDAIKILVEVEYTARFSEPKVLPTS